MPTSNQHSSLLAVKGDASPSDSESSVPSRDPTPLRKTPRSLRPYVYALMAFKHGQSFQRKSSAHRTRRVSEVVQKEGKFAAALTTLYTGIAAAFSDSHTAVVAIAIHDNTYLLDFSVKTIELNGNLKPGEDRIADYVVEELGRYERENLSKFIGAGVPHDLLKRSPKLCSKLWLDLDIVPISITPQVEGHESVLKDASYWELKCIDEQADSMARKCIMHFGPSLAPLQQVGYRGIVEVDSGFQARILSLDDFQGSCAPQTWEAMMKFVHSLKEKGTKIAFFSSTPQGGGVALMRHALVRLARLLKVDLTWYVPKPRPGVFRITKTIHNILQGVAKPTEFISAEDKQVLVSWIEDNAKRYWLSPGGPLRHPAEGGADVIIIDDPQMPGLIPMIKNLTPDRPVLYRSHIQIRSDLANKEGTPQADVWKFLWSNIKRADMFISHPIPAFVPANVPRSKIGTPLQRLPRVYKYPANFNSRLDGLNKDLSDWDQAYYGHLYNEQCHQLRMESRDVIESYAEFRHLLAKHSRFAEAPQLVICGNGSVDDPDGTIIYDQTMSHLESKYPHLLADISVMRLAPNDQLLNTLLSASHIVLQLSTREGFEVKVSEALHKGKPVIATNCGGIPLQVQNNKNGYLVDPGDWSAVAGHLLDLWTDDKLYNKMSAYAKVSVSDEVGTVGNALSWFYLADMWSNGKPLLPNEKWVNDLAREEAGLPYLEGENRLPRF
ncbi:hypothetical protein G7Y89_g12932 [Cudoniella acicularis]|uniref:Glycosyl transferase family 1 domain-containing protein n=1 Tax=Cudoniella acicularis TaxID=354080 RepID=A0A8H4RA97_9HELO|nr:hypothetical protein G7Y89_g12932 [Cudoniella acicularis]